jgi:hypothetical protein
MAGLRVRRSWWIMGQAAEAPLFRVLARKWRPVDKRERRKVPFQLALPGAETPVVTARNSFGPTKKNRMAALAAALKKPKTTWNRWQMMK